ncbi:hypothetical protein FOL47_004471, partial [Perkinsus chesapeaki]
RMSKTLGHPSDGPILAELWLSGVEWVYDEAVGVGVERPKCYRSPSDSTEEDFYDCIAALGEEDEDDNDKKKNDNVDHVEEEVVNEDDYLNKEKEKTGHATHSGNDGKAEK